MDEDHLWEAGVLLVFLVLMVAVVTLDAISTINREGIA